MVEHTRYVRRPARTDQHRPKATCNLGLMYHPSVMNEPLLHRAPTIVRTSNVDFSYYGPPGRPPSNAELAERAQAPDWGDGTDWTWPVAGGGQDLDYWLQVAEKLRIDAQNLEDRGRIADAFVQYAKSATIVLEGLPTHPDYQTLLTQTQSNNLRLVCIVKIMVSII